jgi:outer membrane biosynthesis protein TonB
MMASYTRLGSYMLSCELAADPLGKVHRGLSLSGSAFERHHLIRTFSDEAVEAGLGAKVAEMQRVAGILTGSRGFGGTCHIEAGRPPVVVSDYIPGRSLAQVLRKTREEQIPLGVDHSLAVIQGLSQSLLTLAGKDLHHGSLSPHSIWVSFEGSTQVVDAAYAGAVAAILPRAKQLEAALAPYRNPALGAGLQQDLFALGAILYEMLTLEKLPTRDAIPGALAKATLKAAQEDGPFPPEIAGLLARVLTEGQPFASMGDFNKELERILYDGDYSPTTFNMAFYMHTLFREESDQDAQSIKADQNADFTPFLPSDAGSRSMLVGADGQSRTKAFVIGGAVVLALFGFMGRSLYLNNKRTEDLQEKIAGLQREKAANDNKLLDLTKQEEAQKVLQEQLTKKATEAKTSEERAKAKKDLEESKAKAEELSRQKDEALKKKQELATASNTIVQNAQHATPPPAPAPAPAPAPVKQEPAPAPAPAPAQVVAAPPQAAAPAAQDVAETAPTLTNRKNPVMPRLATKALLPPNLRDTEIKVMLKVFVDAQGHPVKVVILQGVSGPFGYNDAAQNAALGSGFNPGTRNGKPAPAWLTLEYNFGRPR